MGHKIVKAMLLILLVVVIEIPSSRIHAQNSVKNQVFAVSNLGEQLDFKTLANELSQTQYGQAFSEKMMFPQISGSMNLLESFFTPDSIIGDDDRFKVGNTPTFPWSTVAKIQGNFDIFSFNCSGWVLGPSTVVTSAHCIYDYGDTNAFATNVVVIPALDSDSTNSEPFGRCEASKAWIINLWRTMGDERYDYGVYALNCRVGEQTGNLGYRVMTDSEIDGAWANLTGYPMDKGGTTMWFGLGHVFETPVDFLFYDNDATGGQSGAPVWELITDSCLACVVAIHSGSGNGDHNVGVRITNDVFDFLFAMQQWKYDYPVYLPIILKNDESGQQNLNAIEPYPAPDQTYSRSKNEPYPAP